MTNRYTPLVLIFFALVANQASAAPRVEGLARCALNDAALAEGCGAAAEPVATPAAAPSTPPRPAPPAGGPGCSDAAVESDDLALAQAPPEFATDEAAALLAQAVAVEDGMRALTHLVASPSPGTALELPSFVDRAAKAIGSVIMVPLRYGCAVFGAGADAPPPPPVKKHKPRMLTLF